VQALLLEIQMEPLNDEIFEAIEHVFFDEAEVAGQFLMVDELLDLVVETDPLH